MRKYLPDRYEKDLESAMTPSELGAKRANDLLERIRAELTQ